MTQYHQNSRRPPRRNNNNRNHHSAPRVSNWLDEHQREDDRIAPSGVSASTHRLQQWALSTAGMIQQPTKRAKSRALEEEIRDRIQRRYEGPRNHRPAISESDDISMDQNAIIDLTGDDTSASVLTSTMTKKRPRSPSPGTANPLNNINYAQSIKRRRSRSPSPIRSINPALHAQVRQEYTLDDDFDYDYAQSSEWSFPSIDEEDEEMK